MRNRSRATPVYKALRYLPFIENVVELVTGFAKHGGTDLATLFVQEINRKETTFTTGVAPSTDVTFRLQMQDTDSQWNARYTFGVREKD